MLAERRNRFSTVYGVEAVQVFEIRLKSARIEQGCVDGTAL